MCSTISSNLERIKREAEVKKENIASGFKPEPRSRRMKRKNDVSKCELSARNSLNKPDCHKNYREATFSTWTRELIAQAEVRLAAFSRAVVTRACQGDSFSLTSQPAQPAWRGTRERHASGRYSCSQFIRFCCFAVFEAKFVVASKKKTAVLSRKRGRR